MEDLEKCVVEDLSVVISVCFHVGDKTHKEGVYENAYSLRLSRSCVGYTMTTHMDSGFLNQLIGVSSSLY